MCVVVQTIFSLLHKLYQCQSINNKLCSLPLIAVLLALIIAQTFLLLATKSFPRCSSYATSLIIGFDTVSIAYRKPIPLVCFCAAESWLQSQCRCEHLRHKQVDNCFRACFGIGCQLERNLSAQERRIWSVKLKYLISFSICFLSTGRPGVDVAVSDFVFSFVAFYSISCPISLVFPHVSVDFYHFLCRMCTEFCCFDASAHRSYKKFVDWKRN